MKVIEGFAAAASRLARRTSSELPVIPPRLKSRLRELFNTEDPAEAVAIIIAEVRRHGDAALIEYAKRVDGISLTALEVSRDQIKRAYKEVDASLVAALKLAAGRIRDFHQAQKDTMVREVNLPGLRQLVRPLQRVGAYVPGGTASYPSTVLMTAVPARVAGVGEIVMTTPPGQSGSVPALTLVAADIAGVDRVFAAGGAQAVAALAYGTASIPAVDKIVGPGNVFVMLAKRAVFGTVGIDGLQGPSEILIIADDTCRAEYCVADLLAQAEHDALASSVLVTTSRRLAQQVQAELERQTTTLPRGALVAESLAANGLIVIVESLAEAVRLADLYAPEHLALMTADAGEVAGRIYNAGCIFVGQQTSVVMGDYIAGPSHALPTGGTARFSSPLNVLDFVKLTSVIETSTAQLAELGPPAKALAAAEGLDAHARAIAARLKKPAE